MNWKVTKEGRRESERVVKDQDSLLPASERTCCGILVSVCERKESCTYQADARVASGFLLNSVNPAVRVTLSLFVCDIFFATTWYSCYSLP
jgi:hypothetical protein